jgi:hypothetical protein
MQGTSRVPRAVRHLAKHREAITRQRRGVSVELSSVGGTPDRSPKEGAGGTWGAPVNMWQRET